MFAISTCLYFFHREITENDRFIIIASDGVFEFITNQMVADEVANHEDPLEACKAVVNSAYNLWLQYEVRTDDITMIAIYLDSVPPAELFNSTSSFYTKSIPVEEPSTPTSPKANALNKLKRGNSVDLAQQQRPVRRVMSREKRKNMIEIHTEASDDDSDNEMTEEEMKKLKTPKSSADAELIGNAIKSNFLFQHLNPTQRTDVINLMQEVVVTAGDRIIKQGDKGDRFYVVNTGRYEVRVRTTPPTAAEEEEARAAAIRETGTRRKSYTTILIDRCPSASKIAYEPNKEALGNVVHVYESGPNSHPGFGELSLMYE